MILIIIIHQVIHSRSDGFQIKVQSENLKLRLNMMQYISHEVRTPLNTACIAENLISSTAERVLSNLKILLDSMKEFSNSKYAEDQKLLETCVEQLNRSINDISNILESASFIKESCELSSKVLDDGLNFDKIDDNMIVLETEEVDLVRFVDEILKPYISLETKPDVKFSSRFIDRFDNLDSSTRFTLQADKTKLRQVFANFISNSLKFTSHGEIKIIVELKKQRKDKELLSFFEKYRQENDITVRISVVDTGCGLSSEQQQSIFNQYVQFNAHNFQQGNGTGLGLWISKSISYQYLNRKLFIYIHYLQKLLNCIKEDVLVCFPKGWGMGLLFILSFLLH
jgi:signal transduction histidine kinase